MDRSLDEGVAIARQAYRSAKVGTMHKGQAAYHLANWLVARFTAYARHADIDEAIGRAQEAHDAANRTPNEALAATTLADCFGFRFYAYGERGDINDAVTYAREAYDAAGQRTPDRVNAASALANWLGTRFIEFGDPTDLDDAVNYAREGHSAARMETPERASATRTAANVLGTRFHALGDRTDIDEAIAKAEESYELFRDKNDVLEQAAAANDCALWFGIRFEAYGQRPDIEAAVTYARKAHNAFEVGTPNKAAAAVQFANALGNRFAAYGERADINEAITAARHAAHGSYDKGRLANTLANRLGDRFAAYGERPDIDEAITEALKAYDAFEVGTPNKAAAANTLANRLGDRFAAYGERTDIDEAITYARKAQRAVAGESSQHETEAATTLANQLGNCFHAYANSADLDEAVTYARKAQREGAEGTSTRARGTTILANLLASQLHASVERNPVEFLETVDALLDLPWSATVGRELETLAGLWRARGWAVLAVEPLVRLVGLADPAVDDRVERAWSWGPELAVALLDAVVEVEQREASGQGWPEAVVYRTGGDVAAWLGGLCARLDPDAPDVLSLRERAVRAGVVACEMTRARALSWASVADGLADDNMSPMGVLRANNEALARRLAEVASQIHVLSMNDHDQDTGPGRTARDQLRRLRVEHEDLLERVRDLGDERGVVELSRFGLAPDFERLQGPVPAGAVAVYPVAASGVEHGWLLIVGDGFVTCAKTGSGFEQWQDLSKRYEAANAALTTVDKAVLVMGFAVWRLWLDLALPLAEVLGGRDVTQVWWMTSGPLAGLPVGVAPSTWAGVFQRGDTGDGTRGDMALRGRTEVAPSSEQDIEAHANSLMSGLDMIQIQDGQTREVLGEAVPRWPASLNVVAHLNERRPAQRPTTGEVSGGQGPPNPVSIAAFGANQYHEVDDRTAALPALIHAESEAEDIAELYNTKPAATGDSVTADALTTAAESADFVHLALHADDQPPVIHLPAEVLSTSNMPDWEGVELVTAACCNAKGSRLRADEHLSIVTTLILKGAAQAIGSTYPIPDKPTRTFMTNLHTRIRDGQPPATALHNTRQELQEQYPGHPHVWANLQIS